MKLSVRKISDLDNHDCDCLVVGVTRANNKAVYTESHSSKIRKIIDQLIRDKDLLVKSPTSIKLFISPPKLAVKRLLLVDFGDAKKLTTKRLSLMYKAVLNEMEKTGAKNAVWNIESICCDAISNAEKCRRLAQTVFYDSYQNSTVSRQRKSFIKAHAVHALKEHTSLRKAVKEGMAIAKGANFARMLGDLPGNICTPAYLANQAKDLANYDAVSVKILAEKDMKKLKMNSLLSVSAGSEEEAKLIVLEYKGGKKNEAPIAFVGKGITFDSGGISLKPGASMDGMKYDMCGAAAVLGVFKALTENPLPLNVVGVIAASENLPSGKATKPGDIVESMSGQSIEILNTDAEGRLVLCDALTYTERFKPKAVIDIATLTGACVVALGHHASGLYSNDESLAKSLIVAGEASLDRAWQMPLWEEYDKQLKSNFADMANIGGRSAGSITAACFLVRFTEKFKWAHLDIAGTAWVSGNNKGATGRPVPLLFHYLMTQ